MVIYTYLVVKSLQIHDGRCGSSAEFTELDGDEENSQNRLIQNDFSLI